MGFKLIKILIVFLGVCLISNQTIVGRPTYSKNALKNKLDKSVAFPMKWKRRIGLTTFRTTIGYHQGVVAIGSNGQSYGSVHDPFDGLYLLDPETGDIVKHIRSRVLSGQGGDLDVNGVGLSDTQLFFGNDDNLFFSFDYTGRQLWSIKTQGDVEGAPALADFNADNHLDVCFGTESGELIVADGLTGEIIWSFQTDYDKRWTYPVERGFIGSPIVTDMNGDGIRDVIVGARNGILYAFNGKNGQLFWLFKTKAPSGIHASPMVKNKTIYFAESYARVYGLTYDGDLILDQRIKGQGMQGLFSSPVLTPDNDIFIGSSGFFRSKNGGWLLSRDQHKKPKFIGGGKTSSTAFVADVLGRGAPQIGFVTESGQLILVSLEGDVVAMFMLPAGAEASPFVADIDKDGYLEILIATTDQFLRCYETESKGTVLWSGFRGNNYNTGVYLDDISEEVLKIETDVSGNESINMTLENQYLIAENSIGFAQLGMTFGRLKKILGPGTRYERETLRMGLQAHAVIQNREVQFYILTPFSGPLDNTHTIAMLGTTNPKYKTSDGVGPGDKIDVIDKIYGSATLTFQPQYPYQELISFKKQPSSQIWFSVYSKERIGTYAKSGAFSRTKKYKEGAQVDFVGIKRPFGKKIKEDRLEFGEDAEL